MKLVTSTNTGLFELVPRNEFDELNKCANKLKSLAITGKDVYNELIKILSLIGRIEDKNSTAKTIRVVSRFIREIRELEGIYGRNNEKIGVG